MTYCCLSRSLPRFIFRKLDGGHIIPTPSPMIFCPGPKIISGFFQCRQTQIVYTCMSKKNIVTYCINLVKTSWTVLSLTAVEFLSCQRCLDVSLLLLLLIIYLNLWIFFCLFLHVCLYVCISVPCSLYLSTFLYLFFSYSIFHTLSLSVYFLLSLNLCRLYICLSYIFLMNANRLLGLLYKNKASAQCTKRTMSIFIVT